MYVFIYFRINELDALLCLWSNANNVSAVKTSLPIGCHKVVFRFEALNECRTFICHLQLKTREDLDAITPDAIKQPRECFGRCGRLSFLKISSANLDTNNALKLVKVECFINHFNYCMHRWIQSQNFYREKQAIISDWNCY